MTGSLQQRQSQISSIDHDEWGRVKYPLGAVRHGDDITFAVFSRRATRVLLEIYDAPFGADAVFECFMTKHPEDQVFRAKLRGCKPNTVYGFRCWGPNWPYDSAWRRGGSLAGFLTDFDAEGNRFNPNKVLFDPYARELTHDRAAVERLLPGHKSPNQEARGPRKAISDDPIWVFATGPLPHQGIPVRSIDTGRWAPKGIAVVDATLTGSRPFLPPEKAIIYEGHVRGITQHPSASRLACLLRGVPHFETSVSIPPHLRGTYAGAAYFAPYLRALGFSTLELLPIQHAERGHDSVRQPDANFWGYMTLGYFAPDRRFAFDKRPGGPTREFKQMVRAFHDQGIEVYLDVVYNHTGEGGNWFGRSDTTGFVSLGGFDAAEYYLESERGLIIEGATGCGNQLNCSSHVSQSLVLDSLQYWIDDMGIDGFRFDLAPVLGRIPNAFERTNWTEQRRFFRDHPLLERIRDLGRERSVEMIAEAWDLWGYEVGNFPADWGEWNGRYRDATRRFMRGDGNAREFADAVNGDSIHFNDQGGPQRSVDFIVAHDGFTLLDLVSYNVKNNQNPWPFGPSDGGSDENLSWDSGGDAGVRRQRVRNFWVILMFSRGIPMAVYGDELGRTQNGNNNPWSLDSIATWNNYDQLATNRPTAIDPVGEEGMHRARVLDATHDPLKPRYHDNFGTAQCDEGINPLFRLVQFLLELRQRSAILANLRYGDLSLQRGDEVTYRFVREDGRSAIGDNQRCLMMLIDGYLAGEGDFALLINMWSEAVPFQPPTCRSGHCWRRLVDTAVWAEPNYNYWRVEAAAPVPGAYSVNPFSIVVLEQTAAPSE
ncbi:MAG TPA: alpha-amylase family glycosyl hydrolase [Polyangiaceae bacterium]